MDLYDILPELNELGLYIQDMKGGKAYPNHLWKSMGYTEDEMLRFGFLNFVHPDDRERIRKTIDDFMAKGGVLTRFVFRLRSREGEWRWIISSCRAIERDREGRVLVYAGFDHDITREVEAKERAEKALREAETLRSANGIIASHLERNVIITAILEQAERVISFNSASVQLVTLTDGKRVMEIVGGLGFPEGFTAEGVQFLITGETPNAVIIETQKAMILNKEEIDSFSSFSRHSYGDIRCWMGIPIVYRRELLGMIAFDRLLDQPFDEDDLRMGQAFADQVAVALDNARLYEEAKRAAVTDALTGCYARRFMFSELERQAESVERHGHNLSLIMFDVDDFKSVNDTYGHLTGDHVLIKITQLTQGILRKNDSLCRSGGEEFIIILPYVNLDAAEEVAERIRVAIERESRLDVMTGPVTVSLGCVEFSPGDRGRIDEFISRADKAMYCSKHTGKNRTTKLREDELP